jgi:hypothetical protein
LSAKGAGEPILTLACIFMAQGLQNVPGVRNFPKLMDARRINMGLDQYAYVAAKANAWQDGSTPRELSYWRKHPNLQGWMEQLWREKGCPGVSNNLDIDNNDVTFNGVEVELTWADLDRLEEDIKTGQLPATSGFFFGVSSDDYYREDDLAFVRKARAELFMGLRVFYNSSW